MAFTSLIPARFLRAALFLVGGWLVLEYALLSLIAERIGWGATLAILSVKGGLGLLIVGVLAARGLAGLKRREPRRPATDIAFQIASAVLITLPGLAPTFLGVALFAPSLRAMLLNRFRAPAQNAPPREIDLENEDWRELKTRRIARKAKPRQRAGAPDALEAKPPSV